MFLVGWSVSRSYEEGISLVWRQCLRWAAIGPSTSPDSPWLFYILQLFISVNKSRGDFSGNGQEMEAICNWRVRVHIAGSSSCQQVSWSFPPCSQPSFILSPHGWWSGYCHLTLLANNHLLVRKCSNMPLHDSCCEEGLIQKKSPGICCSLSSLNPKP
jgi:hypothetical protein